MGKRIGNPNQRKLVEEIINLGYEVRVIRNQICVEGHDPMTGYGLIDVIRAVSEEGENKMQELVDKFNQWVDAYKERKSNADDLRRQLDEVMSKEQEDNEKIQKMLELLG